jgi:antibiotic biosynthesis monooxygenase (ABM) superfamily enzyme
MNDNSNSPSAEQVAVLTLRTAKPGLEEKFEEALHDFISVSFETEGQLGVHVVRPPPGSPTREYGIVRRFSSRHASDNFYQSQLFKQWEEKVAQLTEGGPVRQKLTGLEAWFTLPSASGTNQPPRWKMAAVTALGVWPVSIFVPWLLNPLLGNIHPWIQALFVAIGIVILLTWVVMPVLVRSLSPWLQQHS